MRERELRGHINRAKAVYVFVDYAEPENGGCYLQIPKSAAKELCDDAKENEIAELVARCEGRDVYIGPVQGDAAPTGAVVGGDEEE